MSLSGALRGGSSNPLVIGCTHTLQIFCWQMVLDFRPHTSIPPKVCDLAIRRAYLLGGLPPDTRLIQLRHPDFLQGNNGFLNRLRARLTQRQREIEQEPRAVRIIEPLIGMLIFVSQSNWNSLSDVPSNFIFSLAAAGALVEMGVNLYNITQNIPHYILNTHQFLQNKIITPMGNLLQVQRAQDPLEHLLNPIGLTPLLLFVTLIINEGEDNPSMVILIVLANIFFNAVLGQNLNEPEVNQAQAANPDENEDELQGPRLH